MARARLLSPLLHLRHHHRLLSYPMNLNFSPSLFFYSSVCNISSSPIGLGTIFTRDHRPSTVSDIAKDLLSSPYDASIDSFTVLESRSTESIVLLCKDASSFVDLLSLLKSRPLLALQVFEWRRKLPDSSPLTSDEYASAIALAGRAHNLSLANELFTESISKFEHSILYNALMTAYMYNNDIRKTQALFDELGNNPNCKHDTVSYNILLSLYGRHNLINHMESILLSMDSNRVSRTVETYNNLIQGYLISRNWKKIGRIFVSLEEERNLKPNPNTYLLMLRGYAIAGELEKMERIYDLVKMEVITKERSLIWVMIWAYCCHKSPSRIKKIEELLELLKKKEIFPWLHVLLLRVYAEEGSLDEMERIISEAFKSNIVVTSKRIIRLICGKYFSNDEVERLGWFVRNAELAGWILCTDLYHCKMVLYSRENKLAEMRRVVDELHSYWPRRNRRTLVILLKAYLNSGFRLESDMVFGLLWKSGFEIPSEIL